MDESHVTGSEARIWAGLREPNDGKLASTATTWIRAVQENYAPRLWALSRYVEPDRVPQMDNLALKVAHLVD